MRSASGNTKMKGIVIACLFALCCPVLVVARGHSQGSSRASYRLRLVYVDSGEPLREVDLIYIAPKASPSMPDTFLSSLEGTLPEVMEAGRTDADGIATITLIHTLSTYYDDSGSVIHEFRYRYGSLKAIVGGDVVACSLTDETEGFRIRALYLDCDRESEKKDFAAGWRTTRPNQAIQTAPSTPKMERPSKVRRHRRGV